MGRNNDDHDHGDGDGDGDDDFKVSPALFGLFPREVPSALLLSSGCFDFNSDHLPPTASAISRVNTKDIIVSKIDKKRGHSKNDGTL